MVSTDVSETGRRSGISANRRMHHELLDAIGDWVTAPRRRGKIPCLPEILAGFGVFERARGGVVRFRARHVPSLGGGRFLVARRDQVRSPCEVGGPVSVAITVRGYRPRIARRVPGELEPRPETPRHGRGIAHLAFASRLIEILTDRIVASGYGIRRSVGDREPGLLGGIAGLVVGLDVGLVSPLGEEHQDDDGAYGSYRETEASRRENHDGCFHHRPV